MFKNQLRVGINIFNSWFQWKPKHLNFLIIVLCIKWIPLNTTKSLNCCPAEWSPICTPGLNSFLRRLDARCRWLVQLLSLLVPGSSIDDWRNQFSPANSSLCIVHNSLGRSHDTPVQRYYSSLRCNSSEMDFHDDSPVHAIASTAGIEVTDFGPFAFRHMHSIDYSTQN